MTKPRGRASKQQLMQQQLQQQQLAELYPGLNDIADAFEALPLDLVRYFTLLHEIDSKCVSTTPVLLKLIQQFLGLPVPSRTLTRNSTPEQIRRAEADSAHRENLLAEIRDLIRELMPCLEEKMHVAGVAADAITKHLSRINHDFDLIVANEIPESVRIGPLNHPAMILDSKLPETKSAQAARSESRREALAAKKAAQSASSDPNSVSVSRSSSRRAATPSARARGAAEDSGTDGGKAGSAAGRKHKTQSSGSGNAASGTAGVAGTYLKESTPPNGPAPKRRRPKQNGPSGLLSVAQGADGLLSDGAGGSRVAHGGVLASEAGSGGTSGGAQLSSSGNSAAGSEIERSGTPNGAKRSKNVKSTKKDNGKEFATVGTTAKVEKVEIPKHIQEEMESEPVYCYCQQVSYGEMVGCDGADCKREWFHLPCIGLSSPPKGKWYCNECTAKMKKAGKK